jgi:hypothetical protein
MGSYLAQHVVVDYIIVRVAGYGLQTQKESGSCPSHVDMFTFPLDDV